MRHRCSLSIHPVNSSWFQRLPGSNPRDSLESLREDCNEDRLEPEGVDILEVENVSKF